MDGINTDPCSHITLLIQNESLHCKKTSLSASIPYFRALFESGMKESSSSMINLDLLSLRSLRVILDYYKCFCECNPDKDEDNETMENLMNRVKSFAIIPSETKLIVNKKIGFGRKWSDKKWNLKNLTQRKKLHKRNEISKENNCNECLKSAKEDTSENVKESKYEIANGCSKKAFFMLLALGEDRLPEFFDTCQYLAVDELLNITQSFTSSNIIKPDNCITWLNFAKDRNLEKIMITSMQMMCQEFIKVSNSEDFYQLSCSELIMYLSHDDVNVASEDVILQACMRWLSKQDKNAKSEKLKQIVSPVRLDLCSSFYLCQFMDHYGAAMDESLKLDLLKASMLKLSNKQTSKPRKGYMKIKDHLILVGGGTGTDFENNNVIYCKAVSERCLHINNKHQLNQNDNLFGWRPMTNIPDCVNAHQAGICSTQHKIIITGGQYENETASKKCAMYHTLSDKWLNISDLNTARYGHGAVVIGTENDFNIYAFGGCGDYTTVLDSVEIFNSVNHSWSIKEEAKMLHPIYFPITATIATSIYVILSRNSLNKQVKDSVGNCVQMFDTISQTWIMKCSLPDDISTYGAQATVIDDCVYLVGGMDNIGLRYDSLIDSWSCIQPPKDIHIFGAVTRVNNEILIIGGAKNVNDLESSATTEIENCDPNKKYWNIESFCEIPISLSFHSAFVLQVETK